MTEFLSDRLRGFLLGSPQAALMHEAAEVIDRQRGIIAQLNRRHEVCRELAAKWLRRSVDRESFEESLEYVDDQIRRILEAESEMGQR